MAIKNVLKRFTIGRLVEFKALTNEWRYLKIKLTCIQDLNFMEQARKEHSSEGLTCCSFCQR
jgi:hypothetical protein